MKVLLFWLFSHVILAYAAGLYTGLDNEFLFAALYNIPACRDINDQE